MSHSRLLVVQPLPGIGDMVWHLSHIRALAEHAGGPVVLLAKPRSRADELFHGDDAVAEVLWVDRNPRGTHGQHDGMLGLLRLSRTLRARRFDAAVVLHNSPSLAFATMAAGIPLRQGYGLGAQRLFLNKGPFLTKAQWRQHTAIQRATLFLRSAGIPLQQEVPRLFVDPAARDTVRARLTGIAAPFVAFGIGSSEPERQWGAQRFAVLARALLDSGWPSIVLAGGPGEATLANEIAEALGDDGARLVPALGWHLSETAALLASARFYVGNDTGAMNMAVATGTRAYCIFGTIPVRTHDAQIVPIVSPPGGPHDGVLRVAPEGVLDVIRRDRGSLGPLQPKLAGILRSAGE